MFRHLQDPIKAWYNPNHQHGNRKINGFFKLSVINIQQMSICKVLKKSKCHKNQHAIVDHSDP